MTRIKPSDLKLAERGMSWEEDVVDGTRSVTGRASCLEGNGIYSQQLVVEAGPAGRGQTKPSLARPTARASRAVHDMHEHGEEEGPRNKCMCAMSRLEEQWMHRRGEMDLGDLITQLEVVVVFWLPRWA